MYALYIVKIKLKVLNQNIFFKEGNNMGKNKKIKEQIREIRRNIKN